MRADSASALKADYCQGAASGCTCNGAAHFAPGCIRTRHGAGRRGKFGKHFPKKGVGNSWFPKALILKPMESAVLGGRCPYNGKDRAQFFDALGFARWADRERRGLICKAAIRQAISW
jgi:hypothetical protein